MLAAGVVALIEYFALERRESARARYGFMLLAWGLATVLLTAGCFQGVYLSTFLATGSVPDALREVGRTVDMLRGAIPAALPGFVSANPTPHVFVQLVFLSFCVAPALGITTLTRVTSRANAKVRLGPLVYLGMGLAHASELVLLQAFREQHRGPLRDALLGVVIYGALDGFVFIPLATFVVNLLDRLSEAIEVRLLGP